MEGAELDVITGMLDIIRQHRHVIICEILDYTSGESKEKEQARATQLVSQLKEIGYSIYRIHHPANRPLTFEKINEVQLQKCTPLSLNLNDYLFLPEHDQWPIHKTSPCIDMKKGDGAFLFRKQT